MTNSDSRPATLPGGQPRPPVPKGLREMLKDYPEHIERLQEVLNHVVETSSAGVSPFDRAIWVLEARLETFISEARDELEAAEASADTGAIDRAKIKLKTIGPAKFKHNWGDDNLFEYFEKNKGTLT